MLERQKYAVSVFTTVTNYYYDIFDDRFERHAEKNVVVILLLLFLLLGSSDFFHDNDLSH